MSRGKPRRVTIRRSDRPNAARSTTRCGWPSCGSTRPRLPGGDHRGQRVEPGGVDRGDASRPGPKLVEPVASKVVEAFSGELSGAAGGLGAGGLAGFGLPGLPPGVDIDGDSESAAPSSRSWLAPLLSMMRQMGGVMFGGQVGQALGTLSREVVSSTDVGLPLAGIGHAALVPAGIASFGEGLGVATRRSAAVPGAARGRMSPAVRRRPLAARAVGRRTRGLLPRHHRRHLARCRRHSVRSTRRIPKRCRMR